MADNQTVSSLLDRAARLYAAGHTAEAAALLRQALAVAPQDPTVRLRHALAIWHGENRAEEALDQVQDLASQYPQAAVFAAEGLILNSLGRFPEGRAAARRAVQADPAYGSAWLDLATATPTDAAPGLAAELRRTLARPGLTPIARRDILFALALTLRKSGQDDAAFQATTAAHGCTQPVWDQEKEIAFRSRLRQIFTPELIAERRGIGVSDPRMIYVVGMPRSGTTLLERLLASHPQIMSVGETTMLGRHFSALMAQAGGTIAAFQRALDARQRGHPCPGHLPGPWTSAWLASPHCG